MTRKRGEVSHSIATQLFRVLFGLYLIVMVIVTAIQLSLEYSRAKDMVTKEIQRVPVIFGPEISTALWTFNDKLLQSILIGMRENPVVVGVIIKNHEGKFVRAIGHIVDAEGNATVFNKNGDQITVDEEDNLFSSFFGYEFSITYIDDEGKAQEIGKGVVCSDTSVILESVKDCLIDVLINSVIMILVLGAIFFFFIRKILGRPLGRLTDAVEKLSFDNLGHQKIDIQVSKRNELKVLEESFNAMTDKLKKQLDGLKDAQEKLFRKEKLAILGQLAGGVAHELRNPLGVIKNACYFFNMKMNTIKDEAVRDNIDIVNREIGTANKIITDLLDFSRIKSPVRQESDINQLVAETLSKSLIPATITVSTDFAGDMTPVSIDPIQVGQIFLNLIENAIQAMGEGGPLKISTTAENGATEVIFVDEGCGIPEKDLEKIFEPLFTTRVKGIGLGLAISRLLAEANGAIILVDSKEGSGTKFTVRFAGKD